MTTHRFPSVAAVTLAAVLSAVFVAVAPVQAQGMADQDVRPARVDPRQEPRVALALRADALAGSDAQRVELPFDAACAKAASAGKKAQAAVVSGAVRSSGV